jgi:hypothetical protein
MPPRVEPVQAMESCNLERVRLACKFRPQFANLEERDKLAMMANCFEIVGPELRACAEKQGRLTEWIRAKP